MKEYVKVRPKKIYNESLNVELSFILKQVVDLVSEAEIYIRAIICQSDYIIKAWGGN